MKALDSGLRRNDEFGLVQHFLRTPVSDRLYCLRSVAASESVCRFDRHGYAGECVAGAYRSPRAALRPGISAIRRIPLEVQEAAGYSGGHGAVAPTIGDENELTQQANKSDSRFCGDSGDCGDLRRHTDPGRPLRTRWRSRSGLRCSGPPDDAPKREDGDLNLAVWPPSGTSRDVRRSKSPSRASKSWRYFARSSGRRSGRLDR